MPGTQTSPHLLKRARDVADLDPAAAAKFAAGGGRALIVSRKGEILLEHYADGIGPTDKLNSYSMMKSLIGALVLRAHADGLIQCLDDPIGRYLNTLGDPAFRAIPIRAFLRMRSDVSFEADGAKSALGGAHKDLESTRLNPFGPMARLHFQGLEGVSRELRVQSDSQGQYDYQNVNTALLGQLLSKLYHQPLEDIISEKIWSPAGARPAHWRRHSAGRPVTAYCCIYARLRDWLLVGNFLLRNGTEKARFLPPQLWRRYLGLDLTHEKVRRGHYGLHIYHDILDRDGEALQGRFSYLFGSRGQIVCVIPERDLVVVRFGRKIPLLHTTLYQAWRAIP